MGRLPRPLAAGPTLVAALLLVALVVLGPAGSATAVAASPEAASAGADDRVPVGLTALGALLGVAAFGLRQWWGRPRGDGR